MRGPRLRRGPYVIETPAANLGRGLSGCVGSSLTLHQLLVQHLHLGRCRDADPDLVATTLAAIDHDVVTVQEALLGLAGEYEHECSSFAVRGGGTLASASMTFNRPITVGCPTGWNGTLGTGTGVSTRRRALRGRFPSCGVSRTCRPVAEAVSSSRLVTTGELGGARPDV